jgi:ribosomal protein L6P/L9E
MQSRHQGPSRPHPLPHRQHGPRGDGGLRAEARDRGGRVPGREEGTGITLHLGFSHTIDYPAPEGIELEVPVQTEVVVKGTDKQLVGQVAAEIRGFRPPEPYKGKGVRYAGEQIRRKAGKTAGS